MFHNARTAKPNFSIVPKQPRQDGHIQLYHSGNMKGRQPGKMHRQKTSTGGLDVTGEFFYVRMMECQAVERWKLY